MKNKSVKDSSHVSFGKKIGSAFGKAGNKTLNGIEKVGNKLPHPFYMFIILTLIVMVVSTILSFAIPNGVKLYDVYADGEKQDEYVAKFTNMFSGESIIWWLSNFITNFTGLSTVGVVLITVLCTTTAEKSGLIDVSLKKMVSSVSSKILTPTVIAMGTISSVASDAGYIILIPLAGVLFQKAGRHPLTGMVAMFAGVSAGFAANIIPASSEALLASSGNDFLGKEVFTVLSNWYFTMFLILVYTSAGWFVTEKIVDKRINARWKIDADADIAIESEGKSKKYKLTKLERKGMWFVLGFVTIYLTGIVLMMAIPGGPFSAPFYSNIEDGLLAKFLAAGKEHEEAVKLAAAAASKYDILSHLVLIIAFLFLGLGISFGFASKNFKSGKDVINALTFAIKRSAITLIIFVVLAQFVNALSMSKMDMVLAYFIGAGAANLDPVASLFLFVVVVAIINMFMGSLSAKWFIIGPIFLAALEQAGIAPSAIMMAYRVGDSSTNIISPVMTYFPLVLVYCQEWLKKKIKNNSELGH